MRNLALLTFRESSSLSDIKDAHCLSVDCDTGNVYCATATHVVGLNPTDGQITGIVSLFDDAYLPPDGSGRVVGIQYLADQQAVCVATDTGNLLLWHVMMGELECVGAVDAGFKSMNWSPDLELLILTTGQDTFIMMTREFEPITEKSLHPDGFGDAQFVTVGWGKKETQFHGSEGKQAAQQKSEEVKPALPWDDQSPRVSWRGDGQCFVISTISPATGARTLRVWSRECDHLATSENVDGIEQALAWKPSGSLIASTMRRPNKHEVVFFERNGLRHGEFTLPFGVKDVKVRELCWNLDSTVLMVWCEDLTQTPAKSYVQLWTVGNYHWYLKQSLHFPGTAEDSLAAVVWDPEHAYRLHVLCCGGKYLQYTWSWTTNCSQGTSSNDQTLLAVIDGDRLLMTPMRGMVVPPPMSAYYVQLPSAVNQVTFCRNEKHSNDLAVVMVDGSVALYKFSGASNSADETIKFEAAMTGGFSQCFTTPQLHAVYSIDGWPQGNKKGAPGTPHHFLWLNPDILTFCSIDPSNQGQSRLYCASFDDSGDKKQLTVKSSIALPPDGQVYNVAKSQKSDDVVIQLTNGAVLQVNIDTETVLPWVTNGGYELSFPVQCPQMAVCDIGGEEVVLGLTDRYRFYANDVEVASNCTSFAVHNEFLLLTTLTHTCRCISRNTKVKVLPTLSDGKAHPFDESVRRVERGSRIVAIVHDDTKLVLQMPRGNLEAIHPRALVLSAIRKHLDKLEFGQAMTYMKKHRINLNLLYDHNPQNFMNNIEKFVRQIDSVNHINLFLTDLREEDCTVTMYTAAYNRTGPVDTHNKVDRVCDAVRQVLETLDRQKYILSILTSYVRKSTPDLEAALLMVKSLRDNPSQCEGMNVEEVLKYLLFLVDVNEMFDIALGTYDFDLVLLVAEKSQKDPKEYIPFLNGLRRLEGHYQQYTIDKHLKRYKKALLHISKSGDEYFEECQLLIQEHKLYRDALQLFPVSSHKYKVIAKMYGEYLTEKRRHEESGIMFVKAEEWALALQAFETCQQWRQVFCMTARLKYSSDAEADIARKLAVQLKMKGQHTEAAVVLDQYAKDVEEAIVCLIEGCQWEEALRMMYKYGRSDFIETNLLEELEDSYSQLLDTLDSLRSDFDKYSTRLDVVRQEKEKARLEFIESGGDKNLADADLFSDTSSATGESIQSSHYSAQTGRSTLYSKVSGASVKNRRKAEHKKWKLKEGSQYEDFALIAALAKIIKSVDDMKGETHSLMKALVQFNRDTQARQLQQTFGDFLLTIETSIPDIWPEENDQSPQPILGPMATANSIAQAMQKGQGVSGSQEKLDPVIRIAPILKKDITWKMFVLEERNT